MSRPQQGWWYRHRWKLAGVLCLCVAMLGMVQDLLQSRARQSAYYWYESGLFALFWLLFLPGAYGMRLAGRHWSGPLPGLAATGAATLLHLLVYPAVILIISALFYEHAFAYRQTFGYALSNHLISCLLVYGACAVFFFRPDGRPQRKGAAHLQALEIRQGHTRIRLPVGDIHYITTESPYVAVHTADGRYLLSDTLKGLEKQLDPAVFVRVHRSAIVHTGRIVSRTSRQNGDYDLLMEDGNTLRLSRTYAGAFRATPDAGQ